MIKLGCLLPRGSSRYVVLLILVTFEKFHVDGADAKQVHSHGPTRPNFLLNAKPMIRIGPSEETKLANGEVVTKQVRDASGGVGAAVEDIAAPPQLFTRFVVGVVPGYNVEYFCHHICNPYRRALCWSLDYDRKSDIDDVHGLWRISPHPTKKDWSRVEYAVDMRLAKGVPGFVVDVLKNKALHDACAWIKAASEKEYQNECKAKTTSSNWRNSFFSTKGGASSAYDSFFPHGIVFFKSFFSKFTNNREDSITTQYPATPSTQRLFQRRIFPIGFRRRPHLSTSTSCF